MSLFARGPKLSLPTFLPARPLRFTALEPTGPVPLSIPLKPKKGLEQGTVATRRVPLAEPAMLTSRRGHPRLSGR